MTQEQILDSLPIHLRPFVKTQRYDDPEDISRQRRG